MFKKNLETYFDREPIKNKKHMKVRTHTYFAYKVSKTHTSPMEFEYGMQYPYHEFKDSIVSVGCLYHCNLYKI